MNQVAPSRRYRLGALLLLAVCAAADLLVAADPPILAQLPQKPGIVALAVHPDGQQAALASASEASQPRHSLLELYRLDHPQPRSIEIKGLFRRLIYGGPDRQQLYGILFLPAKKRAGEAYLVRIDLESMKPRRLMQIPYSARDLDHWNQQTGFALACDDEIRTIGLPGPYSGPLFALPGRNLSVLSLGTGSHLLVGREDGLLTIDLADPPGEESMPVRERLRLDQPVVHLVRTEDDRRVLASTAEGQVFAVLLEPLRLEPSDDAPLVVDDGPESTAGTAPTATIAPRTPTAVESAADAPAGAAGVASTHPPAQAQISGRLTGEATDGILAVVLFGPDNILLEAGRVTPASDGRWSASGLAPGRYRAVLDGGGNRIVVSEPQAHMFVVEADQQVEVRSFHVVGVRDE